MKKLILVMLGAAVACPCRSAVICSADSPATFVDSRRGVRYEAGTNAVHTLVVGRRRRDGRNRDCRRWRGTRARHGRRCLRLDEHDLRHAHAHLYDLPRRRCAGGGLFGHVQRA